MATPVKTFPQTFFTSAEKAYDTKFDRPARIIFVKATGTLFVRDAAGTTESFVIGAASALPFPIYGINVREIVGDGAGNVGNGTTGTDIALADLILCHD